MKKFAYSGDVKSLTTANIKTFIDEFKEGKLTPFLKSEEVPAENNEPVKVIVGKTFKDIVLDETKDVFLEVYAPWCGHCKTLAPIWEELATGLKGISNIVIAKLDGTANEVDGLEVQGFPTLKFYPAGSSTAVDYSGERNLEELEAFIKENSSVYKKYIASKEAEKPEEKAEKPEEKADL